MRYQFYREHKYVSAAFNDVERLIAKTDFRDLGEVENVRQAFDALIQMLKGHATYEDSVLHELLRKRGSVVFEKIEADHAKLDGTLERLQRMMKALSAGGPEDEQILRGYQFYLEYRKFVGENLIHLHEEETIILPELHRLYSDEELSAVEPETYKQMSPDELVGMLEVLFPHMNPIDQKVFLTDIKKCEPEKFAIVWQHIQTKLDKRGQEAFS